MQHKPNTTLNRKNLFLLPVMAIIIFTGSQSTFAQCPLPGAITGFSGNGQTCPGQSKPYSITGSANATSFTWTLPAGCTISGQNPYNTTLLSVTVDFGLTYVPPGVISVKGENICGSGNPYNKNVYAYYPPAPSNITGIAQACPGDVVNYSVNNIAGVTFTWAVPGTMNILSGQGTNAVDVSFNAGFTTTGVISVSGSYGCGAGPTRSKTIVKKNPPPTPASITGPIVACPNETKTYTVPVHPDATYYNWTAPAGTSIAGQGTPSVDITFPANFVQGKIYCRYENNCGNSANQSKDVRATPTVPGLITGDASGLCSCTRTYSVAPLFGATNYTWTPPAGATVVSGQGTNSVDISFGSSVSGYIFVNASNSCGTSSDRPLAVTSNILISQQPQNTSACEDADANISIVVPGCVSYQWRKDGVNLSDNADFSGTLTSTLTIISADSLNGGSYDVVVSSACAASVTSAAATFTVNMKPPVPGPITAPTYACPGNTGVVASVPAGGYNTTGHLWEMSPDATITSGQGTNSITIDFGPTIYSTYFTHCRAENGCGLSHDTSKYAFRYRVSTPHFTSGPTKVCAGQANVDYDIAAVTGATGYTWTTTPGITINSGQGTLTLNVDFDPLFTTGQVCVQSFDPCFTSTFKCKNIVVDEPNVPGNISGPAFSACNTTNTYTINPAAGANSYLWSVPLGATLVSGQGTLSVDVSFANFTSGQICVQSVGNCVNSVDRCLTVKGIPQKPDPITPSTGVFCANQAGVGFSIPPVSGATGYLWTVPSGSVITAGAGTTAITVDLGSNDGNVGARAQNACGNSGTRTYFVDITCRTAGAGFNAGISNLELFPNPANTDIIGSFNSMQKENYQILVEDIIGKAVYTSDYYSVEGKNEFRVDLRDFKAGLYFLKIKSAAEMKALKFVKE